jgi:hypothetical protein
VDTLRRDAELRGVSPDRERARGAEDALARRGFERSRLFRVIVFATDVAGRAFRPAALRPTILFLDTRIDLFAMDLDFGWGFDPELHLTGSHFEHGDLDGITDSNVLP